MRRSLGGVLSSKSTSGRDATQRDRRGHSTRTLAGLISPASRYVIQGGLRGRDKEEARSAGGKGEKTGKRGGGGSRSVGSVLLRVDVRELGAKSKA